MKSKYINPKLGGLVAGIIIFLIAHPLIGRDDDGNLVVFGVPAIVGGLIVYFLLTRFGKN